MTETWLIGVLAIVLGGLGVAGITGNILMYGEQKAMGRAITALADAVRELILSDERRWERYESRHEALRERTERLNVRVSALDKRDE